MTNKELLLRVANALCWDDHPGDVADTMRMLFKEFDMELPLSDVECRIDGEAVEKMLKALSSVD